MKILFTILFLLIHTHRILAQQVLLEENFEQRGLPENWKTLSGRWYIGDVQQKRIAPAENGRQFMLSTDSAGAIRLPLKMPATTKSIRLKFSYYIKHAAVVRFDFGNSASKADAVMKLFTLQPAIGWKVFDKRIIVPAGANTIEIVFNNERSRQPAYFDDLKLSAL